MQIITLDRDSVHAGDDLHSHRTSIRIDPAATLGGLFEAIQRIGYLPGISGGLATWIICSSGKPIGVFAQQWPAPKWVVPAERTVGQFFAGAEPSLLFRYGCQADPDAVFSHINAGNEPPSRF
ncbi:hypothetical protein [Pseudomonas sp. B35(2017)]|uniref:hypothetical protein n=1 Tax=Pseudomonas sp. B35(2017) TaxID=1981722 RepID=UPI000A1D88D3|nr:hypothetical protein [Pseudomonas sp. B35(2017)]